MAKGVSIKFKSYEETVPKLLEIIKFDVEIKKHPKIVLKPSLRNFDSPLTSAEFVESVVKFCMQHKDPKAELMIAEGSDGEDTEYVFEKQGYKKVAEKYGISLLDLNFTETEEIQNGNFLKFQNIQYPKILLESFVITLPVLTEDEDTGIYGGLANMLGAFPAEHYRGFFSIDKNKIKKWPAKYAIHDILLCKMPEFSIMDASNKGVIMAGIPFDVDLQASKLLGKSSVSHLKLVEERIISRNENKKKTE